MPPTAHRGTLYSRDCWIGHTRRCGRLKKAGRIIAINSIKSYGYDTPRFSRATQATVTAAGAPLGLGGQGGGGTPSASSVLLGQGGGGTPSATRAVDGPGQGGGGTPSANMKLPDGGHGGGGTPSARRALVACGHCGGGTPSATTARLLPMVWASAKAANGERAANATTIIRFIRFLLTG